jgi:hypothetical protein
MIQSTSLTFLKNLNKNNNKDKNNYKNSFKNNYKRQLQKQLHKYKTTTTQYHCANLMDALAVRAWQYVSVADGADGNHGACK